MSKNNNIKGIKSISIGIPGDGVVGASLTAFTAIVLNSLSLNGTKITRETLATENIDNYISFKNGSSPTTGTFKLLEITGAEKVMLQGGTWTEADKLWEAPISPEEKRLSVVFETTPVEGRYAKITFPNAFTIATDEGSITQNALFSVNVDITADIPETALGVKKSPYTIQWFDV
jgi:hypothetical protein